MTMTAREALCADAVARTTVPLVDIVDADGRVLMSVDTQRKLVGRVESALYRMSKKNVHDLSLVLYAFSARDPAFGGLVSAMADAVQSVYAHRMGGSLGGKTTDGDI